MLDASVVAAYNPTIQAAQTAAGGRSFRTTGRIVANVGIAPEYQRVGQPGAGAGMGKLGSEEETRTAAR